MIAQVFALQPEEPVPYMIAYLRKHGGAPDEAPAPKPEEASAWRQKYQDLAATYDHSTASLNAFARAAAEREAALAARVAQLEGELHAAVESSLAVAGGASVDQENAILRLTAENQQLA